MARLAARPRQRERLLLTSGSSPPAGQPVDRGGAARSEGEQGLLVHVTGVVQGVGFRPFVFSLAERLGLTGWVRNTSAGVDIAVEGGRAAVEAFLAALRSEAPPLARVERVETARHPIVGYASFDIVASRQVPGASQPVPPDVATCPACLAEVADPADRRYRYPFTNCTNCGPRFTIIVDLPYDRPNTSMASFALCADCAREYADPRDRRYHAQPVACPVCGPVLWLESPAEAASPAGADPPAGRVVAYGDGALAAARRMLASGDVLAIKGLGGFHLACDALNSRAVRRLRERKNREDKPLAVMMRDMAAIGRHCAVSESERELLQGAATPIVLLRKKAGCTVAEEVAPDSRELGVMLPYTPLHHLLFEPGEDAPEGLVMTSGNLSEEPIATGNDEARRRLSPLSDALLLHNRPIRTRCDDSVARIVAGRPYYLRRSRGYAPYPVRLPWPSASVLATGAELKNVFALTQGDQAFLSHHVGDMENAETLTAFEDGVHHLERLFRVRPQAVAHDAHPDYLATRYAVCRAADDAIPAFSVQHHHAHVAACMADNGLSGEEPVIGVAFDGTGLGSDGAIWGGEVLLADYRRFERLLHLGYTPLPGGDAAVREPWRMALAWLRAAGIEWQPDLPPVVAAPSATALAVLARQLELGLNSPPTSSAGRLFDAVASLAGLRHRARFEAQAAIALEAVVDPSETGSYEVPVRPPIIDVAPLISAVVADVRAGAGAPCVAARFHNGMAAAVLEACRHARREVGVHRVALSGGVWQNVRLLTATMRLLESDSFRVLVHRQVPTNDGGLALGQATIAAAHLVSEA